jgi:3-deoxy-D-manno-octulosonic-acid transferase
MSYLLNAVYLVVLIAASPWLIWRAIRKGKYRDGFTAKMLGAAPIRDGDQHPCLWFHAVSVGEVNLLSTLLKEIAAGHPSWGCVVSTTTATGFALAKKKYPHLTVFYAPLDFSWAVRRAMCRVRPTVLVLAELELWPNLIGSAKEHGAKVVVINGRLSAKSFRGYRRIGWLARRILRRVDLVMTQNEEYADRFRRLGAAPERIQITGSLKFDGAQTDRNNEQTMRLRELAGLTDDDIVFLAGSTQAPEEELALCTFQTLANDHPRLKLVLVPRHPHRFSEVADLLDRSGLIWQRRTKLGHNETPPSAFPIPHSPFRILLVDTIGELSAWWGAATIGFVGGSLGNRGGQNMIEPAAYGVATCFGPNTQNFRDIVQMLLAARAAYVIQQPVELVDFVKRCLDEPDFAHELGTCAQTLVRAHRGATGKTLHQIELLIKPAANRLQDAA